MPIEPPLDDFKKYPRMAHWFSPALLLKLLNNVVVSAVFGQYADRRLMVAALDTVSNPEHESRTQAFRGCFKPDKEGYVWLDFVADLGDGFDATYSVASLLAAGKLEFGKEKLSRGQLLVMGGDEVYPIANEQAYRNQLRQPYAWASPDPDRKNPDGVPLLAIPGNHDWYDGLVLFLALFCREKPWHVGVWRTHQRRSYFAFQITETWWLWAIDVQLADNVDLPQADYFRTIAASDKMTKDSKIILCGAEPGWLYTDTNSKSWEIIDYAIGIIKDADKDLSVPVLISGDTHHYSRYSANDGKQFITSGGGGAFLHPTHQLQNKVTVRWVGDDKELSLTTSPSAGHAKVETEACYPPKCASHLLLLRNLWFAITNWDFSLLMAVIYWISGAAITLRDHWDAYIIVALIFGISIVSYTKSQEKARIDWTYNWICRLFKSSPKKTEPKTDKEKELAKKNAEREKRETKKSIVVTITSVLHFAAHVCAIIYFTHLFATFNDENIVLVGEWYSIWIWLGILLLEMGAVGFFVGSSIFGWNMMITSALFRMNTNDAFSAFRYEGYKNFLRLRIKNEKLEIFAIGLDKVPARDGWIPNEAHKTDPIAPVFRAKNGLKPHLIEKIEI